MSANFEVCSMCSNMHTQRCFICCDQFCISHGAEASDGKFYCNRDMPERMTPRSRPKHGMVGERTIPGIRP